MIVYTIKAKNRRGMEKRPEGDQEERHHRNQEGIFN